MGSEKRLRAAVPAFALAVLLSASASGQSASDRETARALMDEGFARRETSDHKGALERFEAADALMHVPSTALEVARSQNALGMLLEARDRLQTMLRIAPKPGEPNAFAEARSAGQALSDVLGARIPALKIAVRGLPDGQAATVSVDGADVPVATLIVPRKVNPGTHVVIARAGSREVREQPMVRERETKEVVLDFTGTEVAPAGPTPVRDEQVEDEAPSAVPRTIAYVGFGVAGIGAIVGTITGLVSISSKNSAKQGCTENRCPPSTFDDIDSARTMGNVSTIAFIVGGAGLVAGVVGLLVSSSGAPKPATTAGVSFSPWIGPSGTGLQGRF